MGVDMALLLHSRCSHKARSTTLPKIAAGKATRADNIKLQVWIASSCSMCSAQSSSSLVQAAYSLSDHLLFNDRLAYASVSSPKGLLDLAWDPSWPATQQTCVRCDKILTFCNTMPQAIYDNHTHLGKGVDWNLPVLILPADV